jgi:hypothetical protein
MKFSKEKRQLEDEKRAIDRTTPKDLPYFSDPLKLAKLAGNTRSIDEEIWRREKRVEERELDLPLDRRCPRCKRFLVNRKDWKDGDTCRSCSFEKVHEIKINKPILMPVQKYLIDIPGSVREEAARLGWSKSKVARLKAGELCDEPLGDSWDAVLVGYDVNGESLGAVRRGYGVGLTAFAEVCGWSKGKQQSLEREGYTRVDIADALTLILVLGRLCS